MLKYDFRDEKLEEQRKAKERFEMEAFNFLAKKRSEKQQAKERAALRKWQADNWRDLSNR